MKKPIDEVSIKFKPGAYGAYRSMSNKVWYALAEFIDNALQSYLARKEEIIEKENANFQFTIYMDINVDDSYIKISDNAGGIDYITKPFQKLELITRVKTHVELKQANDQINVLRGLIPICAHCKKIREEDELWANIESYIQKNSEALFTHTICPECSDKLYGDQEWYQKMKAKQNNKE